MSVELILFTLYSLEVNLVTEPPFSPLRPTAKVDAVLCTQIYFQPHLCQQKYFAN